MKPRENCPGFTLIELSIVLVIIALIAAGVMVGRDMISTAQARKLMSQMENIQLAVNTFRMKYNCMPADCPTAANFGLGNSGNGDYLVGGTDNNAGLPKGGCLAYGSAGNCVTALPDWGGSGPPTMLSRLHGEHQFFWVHLANSGLISGDYVIQQGTSIADDEISRYYPRDVLNKAYLSTFMWNRRFYIRTGFSQVDASGITPTYQSSVLDSAQMFYIANKFGYSVIVGTISGYPLALQAGQKMVPLGINTNTAFVARTPYVSPQVALPATQHRACAVSNGAGGYRYNVESSGNCNMMWQIDLRN